MAPSMVWRWKMIREAPNGGRNSFIHLLGFFNQAKNNTVEAPRLGVGEVAAELKKPGIGAFLDADGSPLMGFYRIVRMSRLL